MKMIEELKLKIEELKEELALLKERLSYKIKTRKSKHYKIIHINDDDKELLIKEIK